MKTIEERARDYAPDALDADFIVPVREGYIVKEQRLAYKQGATEQKAIDIDKAWAVIQRSPLAELLSESWFRKAMEE